MFPIGKYKTSAHRIINGLNHWSKKINVANCNLHLRPKKKKKKDASSQWLVTAVLMSKDRHYIYPEGRCTEPKIRETIRLISDIKNSVCSEGGKAERNVEFKEQIQCILRGIFQRYNPCAVFQINPNPSPKMFPRKWLDYISDFLLPNSRKFESKIVWSSPTFDSWAYPLAWDTPNTNVIRNLW